MTTNILAHKADEFQDPSETAAAHLSAILAEHGGAFCTMPGASKHPDYTGWQEKPKTLHQARAHARRGRNVGLLGGHGGLVVVDFDQDADGGAQLLPPTIRTYRDNAPERAKYIVHVVDGTPPNVKHQSSGTEIISYGGQAVIHGTHPSGAPIRWDGAEIADVTMAQLAHLWRTRTGQELGAHAAHVGEAGPPDAEAVKRSIVLVDKVLALANVKRSPWRQHDGTVGRKAILVNCPFAPEDDRHEADAGAAVLIGADGRIGATCHHARCQERIEAHGGHGWALLKEIAGYTPPTSAEDKAHARAVVEALREWVRRADLAEHVPVVLQACNGYRTRDTDTDTADAILDIAAKWGRLTDLPISLAALRAAVDHVAYIAPLYPTGGNIAAAVERGAIYATSPLTTHRAHDAFTASMTPITETELQARIEARALEIADAEAAHVQPPPPIERKRYRRRLAAKLPSGGRTVKRMIDALHTDGPSCTRRQLRDLLHLSSSALSRTVKRAAMLGLVDADADAITLRDGWAEHLDNIVEFMPTAGRGRRLELADLDSSLRFAQRMLGAQECSAEQRETLKARCMWLTRRKGVIARQEGHRPPPAWAASPLRWGAEDAARLNRLRELTAHGERAEHKAAAAETPTPQVIRQLHAAGYTDAEIAADVLRGGGLVRTLRGQELESDLSAVRGWGVPTIHFDGAQLAAD